MASNNHTIDRSPVPSAMRSLNAGVIALWTHPASRIVAAAGAAATSGTIIALVMPRGPVTTSQALLLMIVGLITGMAAGFLMRSRWAMLVAPAAHIAAFELSRIGTDGPSVDSIHLGTFFGILTFLVGRGVYGILGILPMLLGAPWGMAVARWLGAPASSPRREGRQAGSSFRRAFAGLTTLSLVALALWIASPPHAAPVLDANGEKIPGSVSELTRVTLGGHDQWIEIRGASPDLPILLYLSGGPGQSDLAMSRVALDPLTQDFLMVGWDQRGTGKSYPALDPDSLTLDQAIADTVELTNYLRTRFDEQKIYILGESWGATLAVLAAQRHPELYYAIISSGQMVNQRQTDRMIYDDLLAYAREHGDTGLATTLEGFGPPPYADVMAYGVVLQNYAKLEGDYDPPQAYIDRGKAGDVGFLGVRGSEYAPMEKVNVVRGLIDMFAVMYPQLQEIDFRRDVPRLAVPLYMFDGAHELRGRRELAHEWFTMVEAPDKQMFTYADAGHAVAFEHGDDLHRILTTIILPATYPGR